MGAAARKSVVTDQRGFATAEVAVLLVVAVLGLSGLGTLGGAFAKDIATDVGKAHAATRPLAVATQAALTIHAADAFHFARKVNRVARPMARQPQAHRIQQFLSHARDTAELWIAHPTTFSVKGVAQTETASGWSWRLVGPEKWAYQAGHRAAVRRLGVPGVDGPMGLAAKVLYELHPQEVEQLGAHLASVSPSELPAVIKRLESLEPKRLHAVALDGDFFARIHDGRITLEADQIFNRYGSLARHLHPITEADRLFARSFDPLVQSGGRSAAGDFAITFGAPLTGTVRRVASQDLTRFREILRNLAPRAKDLGIEIRNWDDVNQVRVHVTEGAFAKY